jgi:hypothetical protein
VKGTAGKHSAEEACLKLRVSFLGIISPLNWYEWFEYEFHEWYGYESREWSGYESHEWTGYESHEWFRYEPHE